jgi:DUF1009 family protein
MPSVRSAIHNAEGQGVTSPLGLIAGLGDLPVSVAHAAVASGRGVYVLRLLGFEEPQLAGFPGTSVGIGQIAEQFNLLRRAGCREVVFAGIVRRPDFSQLKLDWKGTMLLPSVIRAARDGDDALIRVLVRAFEQEGFTVLGADAIAPDLLTEPGTLTQRQPAEADLADIAQAARVAAALGQLDIGQGCVVCDGLVLAVEAQEGTDLMLDRVASLPQELRGTPQQRRGVLLKRPKPIQERRVDLPVIGVKTVENAARSGLAGIAVEAGGAMLLQRQAALARADALGLFITVFAPEAAS